MIQTYSFRKLPFNLIVTFTIRPAMRLRQTRIIRQAEKKVAMKIKGLSKLNAMIRIYIPKIRTDKTRNEDRKMPNHQKKDFIGLSVPLWCYYFKGLRDNLQRDRCLTDKLAIAQ